MARRISIINFKGGVGKTTLAFNLATGLVRYYPGTRVLLVDIDHQSSLSIVCLGPDAWTNASSSQKTVSSVFQSFFSSGSRKSSGDILIQNPLQDQDYELLDLIPADLTLDDIEIELTSSSLGDAIQSEWNKRTLLCKWLEEENLDRKYDYIFFDCPPATKIVSQNAIAASHGYIIPVVPEAVMERGAPHLHNMITSILDKKLADLSRFGERRRLYVKKTKLVGLAVTRITSSRGYSGYTNDHTIHLDSLERRWGDMLLKPYISQGTGVNEAMSDGLPVYDYPNSQNIGNRGINRQYRVLVEEIKSRIDKSK